jgi:Predicted hydrolases or acyltransferases (alpha/beta hydrolase superfamily)
MDYRGRGRSARDPDWRNYRPETYISDIFDLLAVADAPKIVAVGTSMGGLLTMGLAAYRPTCLAGAVLNDIGPDVDPEGYRRILAYIGADRPHPDYDAAIADMRELFPASRFKPKRLAAPGRGHLSARRRRAAAFRLGHRAGPRPGRQPGALSRSLADVQGAGQAAGAGVARRRVRCANRRPSTAWPGRSPICCTP